MAMSPLSLDHFFISLLEFCVFISHIGFFLVHPGSSRENPERDPLSHNLATHRVTFQSRGEHIADNGILSWQDLTRTIQADGTWDSTYRGSIVSCFCFSTICLITSSFGLFLDEICGSSHFPRGRLPQAALPTPRSIVIWLYLYTFVTHCLLPFARICAGYQLLTKKQKGKVICVTFEPLMKPPCFYKSRNLCIYRRNCSS